MTNKTQLEQDIKICIAAQIELSEERDGEDIGTHDRDRFSDNFNPQRVVQILERQRRLEEELKNMLNNPLPIWAVRMIKEVLDNE